MCARVYVSRSSLRLLLPVCGHTVDMATPVAWSGSAAHPRWECMKEGLEVLSWWQPMQGQSPAAIPFPTRHQPWHCCRAEPGLQGRGACVSQERARSCPGRGALVRSLEEWVTAGTLPVVGDARRRVPAAPMAWAEGGWCLCIYLRTEV